MTIIILYNNNMNYCVKKREREREKKKEKKEKKIGPGRPIERENTTLDTYNIYINILYIYYIYI